MLTDDGAGMLRQLADREAECRALRERCTDLEQQLAMERAALQVVFAAGEANARTHLGIPAYRPRARRRGTHLRSLSAVILFVMLGTVVFHAAHMGLRTTGGVHTHPARRPLAAASQQASHIETSWAAS
jgi:hypothetical protein